MGKIEKRPHPLADYLQFIGAIASGIVVIGYAMYIVPSKRPSGTTLPPDRVKKVEKNLDQLGSQVASIARQFEAIQTSLETVVSDPNSLARVCLRADIKQVSDEVKSLSEALGSDIERSLSVPLLRKDVQKIEKQLEQTSLATTREIDRIYDQNKWFLGLMGTMAVGLLTVTVGNILQARKKEATDQDN